VPLAVAVALLSITSSAGLFYTSNLVIVSGYAFAALLITRRVTGAHDLSWRAWLAGIMFFVFCGLTHVELALHSYAGARILDDAGNVKWHMNFIHIPQALSIWLFLLSMRASATRPPVSGPLLRLRCWWWRVGQPISESVPLEGAAGEALDR
jgi:hypothetical protein